MPAFNIQVTVTENQSQISTLKITNKLPRPSNVISRSKPCNKKYDQISNISEIFIIFGEYP